VKRPPLVQPDELEEVVGLLREGLVAAIPTDTVYGLAAKLEAEAVDRIFAAKRRPAGLALPVLIGWSDQVELLTPGFGGPAARLAERFWPGALTLVVRARRPVGALVGGTGKTVGIRWPDHVLVEELCLALGPLAVTSANRHGEPPCSTGEEVRARFGADEVAIVVDGRAGGRPSTVVDCSGRHPACLREGAIGWDDIEGALAG
jgi:L-threonylcarbamoyladenylate synthase